MIEFKIGLLSSFSEFGGPTVAGSLAGGIFGPSGSLFVQSGQSGANFPTYGANLTIHPDEYFYDKIGVARAISPDGPVIEHARNPTGLTWSTPNTGVDVINEVGYLQPSSPSKPQTWVRADAVYSGSHYIDYDRGGRTAGNYSLFLLADHQFLQLSSNPAEAYRGVYAGFSVEYAPPNLNAFSQYYELRVYSLGLAPSRPFDQMSLVLSDSLFSHNLTQSAFDAGQLAHHDSKSIVASYSARLIHGLYLNNAVSYVDNPTVVTYKSNTGSALNLISGIAIYF